MRLKRKIALVTGAGRGIGEAIARAFAREGAKVAVADIDPKTAQATARKIERGKALALHMDMADSSSVRDGVDAIDRAWDRIVDVNLKGTFLVAQAGRSPKSRSSSPRTPRRT